MSIKEVILATNPSVEGDATALYIARLLKPLGHKRLLNLAHGLPVGGQLEYTDRQTIHTALQNRVYHSMSFINYGAKEMNCKVVYYGTGLSGKTTNVQHIFDTTQDTQRGKLTRRSTQTTSARFSLISYHLRSVIMVATKQDFISTPFLDKRFTILHANLSLKGVDGVVFVVDSDSERMEANIESFEELQKALERQGYDLTKVTYRFSIQQT